MLVGSGGLGSNMAKIFVQMGIGQISLVDRDLVEDSNRNRQLFTAADVGQAKAHAVLRNLAPFAVERTLLRGYYMTFAKWADGRAGQAQAICCGVDNSSTMIAVAKFGLHTMVPVIFTNVSRDGEAFRVFIQRCGPGDPCFGCYMPAALDPAAGRDQSCTPVPAVADILQVAVGFGARATIGEILGVPIGEYNARNITFSGIDIKKIVAKRPDCRLCGRDQ
ncbi:MAG TPA: ThiF family adenylyltransferase [Candidatus Sulfotelmatobacter sp.]|nr:ThiF family adenylyltransferase [Candidatus Sulfotelmatobacter sp.]